MEGDMIRREPSTVIDRRRPWTVTAPADPTGVTVAAAEMGGVQRALNVTDLDEAMGYHLVLFEKPAQAGTPHHLGVEVGSTDDVVAATRRLAPGGLPTEVEDGVTCSHALQDKVWVAGADACCATQDESPREPAQ
jgi:hypothetical protein